MTLVVARVTPLGIRLASDMRVTEQYAAHPRGFVGAALKLVLIRPTLCVGYAGNVGAAMAAVRRVAAKDLALADVERCLLDAHVRAERTVDFVIGSLRPSRLVVVKDGRAEPAASAWIGDVSAYAEYQLYYHDPELFRPPPTIYNSPEQAEDIAIAQRMSDGMEAVVMGPWITIEGEQRTLTLPRGGAHELVGEAIVNVVPRAQDNLFKYSVERRATEGGRFSYSILSPAEPGGGVIGLYFDQPSLGILYAPLLHDEPQRFPNVARDAFIELVRLRHGVSLTAIGG
jgi:hypothetical protein